MRVAMAGGGGGAAGRQRTTSRVRQAETIRRIQSAQNVEHPGRIHGGPCRMRDGGRPVVAHAAVQRRGGARPLVLGGRPADAPAGLPCHPVDPVRHGRIGIARRINAEGKAAAAADGASGDQDRHGRLARAPAPSRRPMRLRAGRIKKRPRGCAQSGSAADAAPDSTIGRTGRCGRAPHRTA